MKILFVSAEVAPYAAVGGLSQVLYFLPRALVKKGHDVRIFTAHHGAMDGTGPSKKPWNLKPEIENIEISTSHNIPKARKTKPQRFINCSITSFTRRGQAKAFFLENKEYFEMRANVFGYKDDHTRFALMSKGCLEWLLKLRETSEWWPDVIHCNDWHTGYFLDLARNDKRYQRILSKIPIVFTIHNFFYQGNINFRYLAPNLQDRGKDPLVSLLSPRLLRQNPLLRGILSADEINTVSPTHALEVLTPEYAEGLEDVLQKVRSKLSGILNGLDTKEFDPSTDPIIKYKYDSKSYALRQKNKLELQKQFNFELDKKKPLIAVCGRISTQKGWELMIEALPKLLSEKQDAQVIVMGQGDERFQNELMNIQRDFPKNLALHLRTDFRLPRKIYSGCDMLLIPSIFEPGGIVALEAMRYGAVPVVRRTGGLNDIVEEFNPVKKTGTGFSFNRRDPWSLYAAIISALTTYQQPDLWNRIVKNCMFADFSWDHAANEYEVWYKTAVEERKRATGTTPHPAYKTVSQST